MPPYLERVGEEPSYITIKLDGDDLPIVEEGEVIPEITLEIIEQQAFWTETDGTKHRVIF